MDGEVVTFFMDIKVVRINFEELIHYEKEFLEYAIKTSDSVSLVFATSKPYKSGYIETYEAEIADKLRKYLLNQYVTGDNFIKKVFRNKVLNCYKSCKEVKNVLLADDSVFLPSPDFPEDICFYRNNLIWFDSVTHEKIANMISPLKSDLTFLEKYNIEYSKSR